MFRFRSEFYGIVDGSKFNQKGKLVHLKIGKPPISYYKKSLTCRLFNNCNMFYLQTSPRYFPNNH